MIVPLVEFAILCDFAIPCGVFVSSTTGRAPGLRVAAARVQLRRRDHASLLLLLASLLLVCGPPAHSNGLAAAKESGKGEGASMGSTPQLISLVFSQHNYETQKLTDTRRSEVSSSSRVAVPAL